MFRILLLNDTYEPLTFITDKRGIKLIIKDKVDVISSWDESFKLLSGNQFVYPAILRLKTHVKKVLLKSEFSRVAIMRRDKNTCQYCGKMLVGQEITIDHILPSSRGGKSNFTNCVVACKPCNNKKNNRTPIEAEMPLLSTPVNPRFYQSLKDEKFENEYKKEGWHSDWSLYLT